MMKVGTLMYATIVLSVLLLQDTVNGDRSVSKKKMKKWIDESNILKNDEMNIGAVDVKNNPKLVEKGDEMQGLIEVIKLVVIDSFNNDEFRSFLMKRFLHSYLHQVLPKTTIWLSRNVYKFKVEIILIYTDDYQKYFNKTILQSAKKDLKKIKKLKKEIDPKSTDEDNKHFEAMKSS